MRIIPLLLVALLPLSAAGEDLKLSAITKPADRTFADHRTIEIILHNVSGHDIDVLTATVTLPAWYEARPRLSEYPLDDLHGDLNDGDVSSARLDLPELTTRQALRALFTEPPLFVYKKLSATVEVHYRYTGQRSEQPVFIEHIDLPAEAPFWQPLGGGVLGVIVAFGLAAIVKRLPKRPLRSLLAAIIVMPIAIVFARLSIGLLPLPVTVDVRDVIGGFAVGLFAVWVAPKLIDKILPEASTTVTPPPTTIGAGGAPK